MKRRSGPISRVLSWTIIYLACTSPCSSSHATRARAGPTHGAPIRACSGRGLPSRRVAAALVVSYTTVSAFLSPVQDGQRESSFLRRFPSGCPAWPLTSFLPFGARTFLTPATRAGRAIVWPASRRGIVPCGRRSCERTGLHPCSNSPGLARRPHGAFGSCGSCARMKPRPLARPNDLGAIPGLHYVVGTWPLPMWARL